MTLYFDGLDVRDEGNKISQGCLLFDLSNWMD